jgi:hypothetical protein
VYVECTNARVQAGLVNEFGEVVDQVAHRNWVAQNERESREADKMATEIVRDTLARRRRKVSAQPTFIAASSHLSDPYLRLFGEVTNWFFWVHVVVGL